MTQHQILTEKANRNNYEEDTRLFKKINPSHPDPSQTEKIEIFTFTLLCDASKGFEKT